MKKIMFNDRYGLTEAVLQGMKTVTRRTIIVPNWACDVTIGHDGAPIASDGNECADRMRCERIKPPYKVGEIVAVAQSYENAGYREDKIFYRSVPEVGGYKKELAISQKGWNNKMFVSSDLMPHQIRILDVRAERLQDITDEDCLREAISEERPEFYGLPIGSEKIYFHYHNFNPDAPDYSTFGSAKEAFATLINKISGRGTWDSNPYVWRIEFELVK